MKIAPVMRAMSASPDRFEQLLVHTGQHYDPRMSQIFFEELELPRPDVNLEVGSGSHTWQTAQVMLRVEPILEEIRPDWVIVVGDVNSTLASALVCGKLHIPLAHVEAGLRSFDRSMPEEINRLLTDQIASLLFTPSADGDENLLREGVAPEEIHRVGNVMIDTLVKLLPKAEALWPGLRKKYDLERYVLVTLHRGFNVDREDALREILAALETVSREIPVFFPVHPRTRLRIAEFGLEPRANGLSLLEPLGYLEFLALQKYAALVLTDSGGIQEESTYLGVPCLTVRPNTERPVTITMGTNQLVACEREILADRMRSRLGEEKPRPVAPPLWDGRAAQRIVEVFKGFDR